MFYQNPKVLVACGVAWQEKLLFCRRAQDPALGACSPPSGFLEQGETLQAGAARETFEEAGIILDPAKLDLYSVINLPAINQIWISFRCDLTEDPMVRPGPESLDAGFFTEQELLGMEIAWQSVAPDWIGVFFQQRRTKRFAIHLVDIAWCPGVDSRVRDYPLLPQA